MKNDNLKIKCSKIEYDPETVPEGKRMPKAMTVELDKDFVECAIGMPYDEMKPGAYSVSESELDDFKDAVCDEIEAKTGASVIRCNYRMKIPD